jgi:replicative DNA helicase
VNTQDFTPSTKTSMEEKKCLFVLDNQENNIQNKLHDLDHIPHTNKTSWIVNITEKAKLESMGIDYTESSADYKDLKNNYQVIQKTVDKLIDQQEKRLAQYRGKDFIGLCQKTIPSLDACLSGLRKFIILAAAPNVGKTALTIQIGIDTLKNNNDTCLLYVSLEMTCEDILDRIRCNLAQITWTKLYFGSSKNGDKGWYTKEEQERLDSSKHELEKFGKKILILDEETDPGITPEKIINYVNTLKKKSGCKRVILIIDYLQTFPVPESKNFGSDNSEDRYRIKQMKKIAKAINNDPMIVISEARKPSSSGSSNWVNSKADILGSSRTGYAATGVLLLSPLTKEDLKNEELPENCIEQLCKNGISLLRLILDKGRDGMVKSSMFLFYHFYENRFEEVTLDDIKREIYGPTANYPNMNSSQISDAFDQMVER